MNENNKLNDILSVAGGNKEIKVGIEKEQILLLGGSILVAVFIAVALAIKLNK